MLTVSFPASGDAAFARRQLQQYLQTPIDLTICNDILATPVTSWTSGKVANRNFFNRSDWATQYLANENCSVHLRDRYQTAINRWNETGLQDKIVVDVGCGPGNIFRLLGGQPKLMLGIDIAETALGMARNAGYLPLIADAHQLPFIDQFADIVIGNATLHHCDDMEQVLTEMARIVRPGGLLITDQDPQITAWQLRGPGFWLHHAKYSPLFPLFRQMIGRPLATWDQQVARFHTEIHNQFPGDGLSLDLYHRVLEPMGYEVNLYRHNHTLGAEVLQGRWGKAPPLIQWAQRLSGLNPNAIESAQSIMCVAQRIR
jgi:ubiquinone/menaquinone biosynthesis C-methylase UbiE